MTGRARYRSVVAALIAFSFLSAVDLYAQQQKVGYVNTDVVLSAMPEYEGIGLQLQLLGQQWQRELDRMEEEIVSLREEFEAREILFTEEIRRQRQEEIEELVQQRERYLEQRFGAEGEYYTRQQELLEPIQRRVFQAITIVAQREEYDFVFDRAADTGLMYFREEWNLNDEVLQELGLDSNDVSN